MLYLKVGGELWSEERKRVSGAGAAGASKSGASGDELIERESISLVISKSGLLSLTCAEVDDLGDENENGNGDDEIDYSIHSRRRKKIKISHNRRYVEIHSHDDFDQKQLTVLDLTV